MSYDIIKAPAALVGTVTSSPRGVIEQFLFVSVTTGDRTTNHALGYREDGLPYITSPLTRVDPASHRVRTSSGSTWSLEREAEAPSLELLGHLMVALKAWGVELPA
jgi:hypothetical protein